MEPNLTYGPAAAEDGERIFRLCRQLIDRYEDPAVIDRPRVLAWIERKIRDHLGEYTRVCLGGAAAGWYRLHPENGAWELDNLYVLPPYRDRGIGTAVVRKCQEETGGPIFLYVFLRNERAVAFYSRLGFRPVRRVGPTRAILRWIPGDGPTEKESTSGV